MTIQKFPLETLKKVRQYIQGTLVLSDAKTQPQSWAELDEENELPEPESLDDLSGVFAFGGLSEEELSGSTQRDRWFVSTVNPADSLLKLPGLSLNPAFRLVSYLYRAGEDGVGLVVAVPERYSTMVHLEKSLQTCGDISQPPKPDNALPQFMEAIDGDRSPLSFLIASLFRRELQEFGALGNRCQWSHHRFIDALPAQANCQWRVEPSPKDFSPKVKVLPTGQAAVEFFTYRAGNPIVIYRHLDQYAAQNYKVNPLDKAIALIQR
ncbi:hypothetical protein C7B76_09470 [filamentous cyanobacterium CCP2]|nr:hypothetical protein C7B76_09470 [filamentous cyanobacterium CCP2]